MRSVSLSALHQALRAKDAERSLEVARALRHVPLRYALRLTLLLAEARHPSYESAARRFLTRTIDELNPPLMEAKKLADALAHVHHHYYGHFARSALQDVVSQLHRIERPLSIGFDGPDEPATGRRRGSQFEDLPPAQPERIADVLDPEGVLR
jgi:hypothetical protein